MIYSDVIALIVYYSIRYVVIDLIDYTQDLYSDLLIAIGFYRFYMVQIWGP